MLKRKQKPQKKKKKKKIEPMLFNYWVMLQVHPSSAGAKRVLYLLQNCYSLATIKISKIFISIIRRFLCESTKL